MKNKLNQIFFTLNQRGCQRDIEPVMEFEDECIKQERQDVLPQFLQTQKNQLIGLQDQLKRYSNVLHVFGIRLLNAKYDINLMKSYLLPLFVDERGNEPIAIKKANQFVPFKFGDVQLLVILNFFGGATSLDFFFTLTGLQRREAIVQKNGSMIQKTSTKFNFLLTKQSLATCATIIPSKKTIQTFKV